MHDMRQYSSGTTISATMAGEFTKKRAHTVRYGLRMN